MNRRGFLKAMAAVPVAASVVPTAMASGGLVAGPVAPIVTAETALPLHAIRVLRDLEKEVLRGCARDLAHDPFADWANG